MKKIYVMPVVEGMEMNTRYGIMIGVSGEIDPSTNPYAKRTDITVEDEEDNEELESFKPEKVVMSDVFSNDYIKKVWD